MKQSLKARLPQLHDLTPFDRFIARPFAGQKYIAHCYADLGERRPLRDVVRPGQDALLLIGPEGDFSEEEVKKAIAAGFIPVSLGRSRLRTETAALVGLIACHAE
jgi:16S rRNA (uracil1498-N3)-methyltransferase